MSLSKPQKVFIFIALLVLVSLYIDLPTKIFNFMVPRPDIKIGNLDFSQSIPLSEGLDIKGGLQVTLTADMKDISAADRPSALESAKEVIGRRIDLFGVSESGIKTAVSGNDYRLILELPGVTDSQQALDLIGQTAKLEFALPVYTPGKTATESATLTGFTPTDLTGADLARAAVTFQTQDSQPGVSLTFKDSGTAKFAKLTKENIGKPIAILLDGDPITMPTVQVEITDGNAQITGKFTTEEAKALAVQLNAGALPVPVSVLSQNSIPATLGADSIRKSVTAGAIGLFMVVFFMIAYYGRLGLIASISLTIYGLVTLALYKLIPVVLSLPGIAGFLLSVGMAVDSNILIFERYKEEIRAGRQPKVAMELAFGRAWNSIKDANAATILTGTILFNPLNWPFLNTSGSVRGFAFTLVLGILISLFTGLVVTRNFLRLFYKEKLSTKDSTQKL
jgi:preprotein translocase subunit SecD